jgi:hypothetical protein
VAARGRRSSACEGADGRYQAERGPRIRAEREQALRDGTAETFGSLFRRRPVYVVLVLLAMAGAAALVLLPFVLLRG